MNDKIFTVQQVIGERPSHVPSGWVIFNAPRPLYGKDWKGDFRHGVFYAAVDPNDPMQAGFIEENRRLDGWMIEYITKEHVWEYGRKLAKEYNVPITDFDFEDVWGSYTGNKEAGWRRQVQFDQYISTRNPPL